MFEEKVFPEPPAERRERQRERAQRQREREREDKQCLCLFVHCRPLSTPCVSHQMQHSSMLPLPAPTSLPVGGSFLHTAGARHCMSCLQALLHLSPAKCPKTSFSFSMMKDSGRRERHGREETDTFFYLLFSSLREKVGKLVGLSPHACLPPCPSFPMGQESFPSFRPSHHATPLPTHAHLPSSCPSFLLFSIDIYRQEDRGRDI